MATVFRPPLITRQPPRWPYEALFAQIDQSNKLLYLNSTPLSAHLVETVRFIANPLVGINAQAWLQASSQNLYLQSTPLSAHVIDPVRFIVNPLVGINAQFWIEQSSQLLYLRSNPIITNWPSELPRRVVQQPTVTGSPLALLSSLTATPIGVQRVDTPQGASRLADLALQANRLPLLTSVPVGIQIFDLRLQPNPWVAVTAPLYINNIVLLEAVEPIGKQMFDLLVQPNPWIALRTQMEQGRVIPPTPPPPAAGGSNYLRRLIQTEYYRERRLQEEGKFDRDQLTMYGGMTRQEHIADLERRVQERMIAEDDEEILRMIDP